MTQKDRDGYCGACHGDGEVWSKSEMRFVLCQPCDGTGWVLGFEKRNDGRAQLIREGGLEGVWE